MLEEWLKKATIKELLEQFEIRCHMIADHMFNKKAYSTEDCLRSQESDYMSHEKVAESAQESLDKLKVEIIKRAGEKELEEEFKKTLEFFRGLLDESES